MCSLWGCYGIFIALQEVWRSFHSETIDRYQPHSFFVDLPNSAVPKVDFQNRNTILNWYDERIEQISGPDKLLHNAYTHKTVQLNSVSFEGVQHVLPILNFKHSISLFFWTLLIFARGFAEALLGRWWTLFLHFRTRIGKKSNDFAC